MSSLRLTDDQVAAYHRDGFLFFPGLFSADEMLEWKSVIRDFLRAEDRLNDPRGLRLWMADQLDPLSADRFCKSHLVPMLRQLVGPELEFLSVKLIYKNETSSFGSPWHQDWSYWRGSNKISVWIAMDDATPENGCLQFIPAMHDRGEIADINADSEVGFRYRISETVLADRAAVTLPARRGDAVFLHDLTPHASHANSNGADRWAFIATYRNAAEADASTVWKSSLKV